MQTTLVKNACIQIDKNRVVDQPCYVTIDEENPIESISLGENSRLDLVVDCCADSDIKLSLAQGAVLHFYKLVRANIKTEVKQSRNSSFNSYSFNILQESEQAEIPRCARDDTAVLLNEPGAEARLIGLYQLAGAQKAEHHLHIDHKAPHCSSYQFYKGILDEKAKAAFVGKVIVHEGAEKTIAHQTNRNLLLSRQAEVNTKPELEIYADDVKCSHAATVGQLDNDAVFYLRSRGLSETAAIELLTEAFANEVFDRIPDESIKKYLREAM